MDQKKPEGKGSSSTSSSTKLRFVGALQGNARRYDVRKELGRGAFAVVYDGLDKHTGLRVAIKKVLRKNKKVSGVGWAGVETGPAGAAMVGFVRTIVVEFQVGQQHGQEEPTPRFLVQQQRVLANPA